VLEDQRAAVRLGSDAFSNGYIRPVTQRELLRALAYFGKICRRWDVRAIRAVGTSALRDSTNARTVIQRLKAHTGIQVHLIDGQKEAALLHKAVSKAVDLRNRTCLHIDMGGGSLEVMLSRSGRLINKESLQIGTVRLLARVGKRPEYDDYARWIRTPLYRLRLELLGYRQHPIDLMIGTGGNLRALGKLCHRLGLARSRNRFHRDHLEILTLRLFEMTLPQRIKRFQLRKDRADVILPAAVATLELMRIFEVDEILVPNVGLKNGLFWELVERRRARAVVR